MKKIKISVVLSEEEAYNALRAYIESQAGIVMPDMKSVTMVEQEDNTMLLEWESSTISAKTE